jgi:hypothetical protein
MFFSFSCLDIGNPRDGRSFEKGCRERLGMPVDTSLLKTNPTLDELTQLFQKFPDWLYLSGHHIPKTLYNDYGVAIDFTASGVNLSVNDQKKTLSKATGDFRVHVTCTLLLWGGCSALRDSTTVKFYRALFDNPVMLGYAAGTGWRINDAMLSGGGFIAKDFFARVREKMDNNEPNAARNAWLETAIAGYGGTAMESMFRAVDMDGQEWQLEGKKIKKGRKF